MWKAEEPKGLGSPKDGHGKECRSADGLWCGKHRLWGPASRSPDNGQLPGDLQLKLRRGLWN